MQTARLLIASRDRGLRRNLLRLLEQQGWSAAECDSGGSAARFAAFEYDLVLLASSVSAESWANLAIVSEIRRENRTVPVLLIVPGLGLDLTLAALRAGANDMRMYPGAAAGELIESVRRLLGSASQRAGGASERILGNSQATQELRAYLRKVADADCNVLITGETGTGKELAAEGIHHLSTRRQNPFIPVNCAAIPEALVESELFGYERGAFTGALASREGKFKQADGGTIFLDEIGDMDLASQAKLLRVIESKEIHSLGGKSGIPLDIRVLAATNRDPEELIRENRFRKDLYFRLNVARIHLKPLRERQDDIAPLVEHTIRDLNQRFSRNVERCTPEAISLLIRYDWPGNVRELRNLLEATFIALERRTISPEDFPESFRRRLEPLLAVPADERERLLTALCATKWNKSKACEALNWSRMTLYRKMAKYQIPSDQV